jgi:hypothetical protein
VKRDAKGFRSGFFSAASVLDGCGDVGYLLIDRLEKEETESQMQGQDTERMKIEGERKKAIRLWSGVGGDFTCTVI